MSDASHRITRLIFETELNGREHVSAIQNRISTFAATRLHTVLMEALSITGDNLLPFQQVELDLGAISFHALEEDLAEGIFRCMRAWAMRYAPATANGVSALLERQDNISNQGSASNLPVHAFVADSLIATRRGNLNAAIASALQGPGDWSQLLAAVRDNYAFRSRLAHEVSPALLQELVQSLAPVHGNLIAQLSGVLASLHKYARLTTIDRHVFQHELWQYILNEVARYQPSQFSVQSFLTNILDALTIGYSLDPSALAAKLAEALQEHTLSPAATAAIVPELKAAFHKANAAPLVHSAAVPPAETISDSSVKPIDDLAVFLEAGALPWSSISSSSYDFDSMILKLLTSQPDEVCSLVRRLGQLQPIRKRIAGQFSGKVVKRLISALDPVNARWMLLCQQQLLRIHSRKPLLPLQNSACAKLLRELALEYLAGRHWHALDAASLLRFLLYRLASRHNIHYETLLAEVAFRRDQDSHTRHQTVVNSAIVGLLEEDLLGVHGQQVDLPRFAVRSEFHHLYSDLDVLAYWLRWKKLPAWSFAPTPEEMAHRIGPLLCELPVDLRHSVENILSSRRSTSVNTDLADASTPVSQIERWLLYGIWPASVALPQNARLTEWLEGQNDSDWLRALRRCDLQHCAIQRVARHLSSAFLVRIISLLAGSSAEVACALLHGLHSLKQYVGNAGSSSWQERVSRYTLTYLLRHAASDNASDIDPQELADAILQALSLHYQISNERLLFLLRTESSKENLLSALCNTLENKLGYIASTITLRPAEPDLAGTVRDSELVLFYLKHGFLPEHAQELSFHELQRLAARLHERELEAIATTLASALYEDDEAAKRTAILLPSSILARITTRLLPEISFIEELEHVLSISASRLSLQPAALIIVARTYLLRQGARRSGNISKQAVISGLFERLTEYTGESPALLHELLIQAANHTGELAQELAKLAGDIRSLREESDAAVRAVSLEPATSAPANQDTLQLLENFLRIGTIPPGLDVPRLMENSVADLLQRSQEYIHILREAVIHAPERRRMARSFSDSLYRHTCRLLGCKAHFSDDLEYALHTVAPQLHTGSSFLVAVCREEFLKYAGRDVAGESSDSLNNEIFESLSTTIKNQTGIDRIFWLRHFEETLGVTTPSSRESCEKKQCVGPQDEVSDPVFELAESPRAQEVRYEQNPSAAEKNWATSTIHALAHLLQTGRLPWWNRTLVLSSNTWFKRLLESEPDAVLQVLRSSGNTPLAVNRLVRYLPRTDLAAIIRKAVPTLGGFLILYIYVGMTLAEDSDLTGSHRSAVSGLHWQQTLLYLLDGSQAHSPTDALRTLCDRVARELKLEYSRYLAKLGRIAKSRAPHASGYVALAEMLDQLQKSNTSRDIESVGNTEKASQSHLSGNSESISLQTIESRHDRSDRLSAAVRQIEAESDVDLAFPNETTVIGKLEYLLRYGILPKTTRAVPLPRFMHDVAYELSIQPAKYRHKMQKLASHDLERKRIACLFSPQTLRHLWPVLFSANDAEAVLCLDELHAAAIACSMAHASDRLRLTCVEELLRVSGTRPGYRWENAVYLRSAIERLVELHSLRAAEIIEQLRKRASRRPGKVQAQLLAALDRVERETAATPVTQAMQARVPTAESQSTPQTEKVKPLPAGEPYYIANAGAILLWPFLGRYFQMLGLKEKNVFGDEVRRSRAMHLIQYLVTGKLEAPEHELLLNKLLCGGSPEQPLESVTPLTAEEEGLSNQLLNSVIQSWEKLRNTSSEGLRQSFLVREGRLLRKESDDSWSLTVSAKGYDMLLDSLPWRLSLVRLPWMLTTLHVKWR